jgi:F-type H+-transporting ATPase subunit delta
VPEITAEFAHQYKALKGITPVRVTSAAPLSEAVLEELRRRIIASGAATSQLELETKIDPELIGGFVLEFDNKRYDASIAHKLDELRGQFSKNLYIKEI